jgi:putative ABC transport system ATP-binding protein
VSVLAATEIAKRYGAGAGIVTALAPVSFVIEAGEYVSIVGPSGSGKSTLMNLIGLLDRPTEGELRIGDIVTGGLSENGRAVMRNQRIGFVFQAYHLLPRLTALRNVELPLIYADLPRRRRRVRAEQALDVVGLLGKRDRLPAQLSGGEQQRVAIARAIVSHPSILLADEPTGALDTASSQVVLGLLEDLNATGCTIIVVTHDMSIAARAARTLCMRDGRIVADQPVRKGEPPLLQQVRA